MNADAIWTLQHSSDGGIGVAKTIRKTGDGEKPQMGEKIRVKYMGMLDDGTVFASSATKKRGAAFNSVGRRFINDLDSLMVDQLVSNRADPPPGQLSVAPIGQPQGWGLAYATPSSAPAAQKPTKAQGRLPEGGLTRALATFNQQAQPQRHSDGRLPRGVRGVDPLLPPPPLAPRGHVDRLAG